MDQNQNGWGSPPPDVSEGGEYLQAGVQDVFLYGITYDPNHQYGAQVTVAVQNPANEENVINTWYKCGYNNPQKSDEENAKFDKTYRERLQINLSHIIGAFLPGGSEEFKTKMYNGTVYTQDTFINAAIALLPQNFKQIPARAILAFGKEKGGKKYLSLPPSLKVTGAFFSTSPDFEFKLNEKRLDLDWRTGASSSPSSGEVNVQDESW